MPLAQAPGMGLNAFFVYTACLTFGLSYANALVLVLCDGVIFILLTVTGLRKAIFDASPSRIKTAISAGIGLFIAMFLSPVAQLIPTYACAAALIYVGVLMMANVKDIEWSDPVTAVAAFMTIAMMPLTYNISYGIAFGLLSYIFMMTFTGKIKRVNAGTWVIGALFTVMFFVSR